MQKAVKVWTFKCFVCVCLGDRQGHCGLGEEMVGRSYAGAGAVGWDREGAKAMAHRGRRRAGAHGVAWSGCSGEDEGNEAW